ncbi:MAG: SdrD B-like domain-containing protein [Phycisphaerales bacterium]
MEELERRLLLSGTLAADASFIQLAANDPKDAFYSLASLYEQYTLFQETTPNVPPGEVPVVFASPDPLTQVTAGHVAIEAIGYDTTDVLKNELLRLGLQNAVQVSYVVAGQLPIASIVQLPLLESLRFVRAEAPAYTRTGLIGGDGDGPLESDDARQIYGVDGTGITVGIISNSFASSTGATVSMATDIANGELPAAGDIKIILDGLTTSTDEGRAMAQIIHDIAPGADIGFHRATGGETGFITAVNQLASGAAMAPLNASDIIVDDIALFYEPMLRESKLSQAIDTVVANGVAYFAAAGNDADLSYESGFNLSTYQASSGGFLGGHVHDFDPGAGVDTLQQITINEGVEVSIVLQWDDLWSSYGETGVVHDLDMYLYDAAGTTIKASAVTGNIGQDPVVVLNYTNPAASGTTTFNLKIVQYSSTSAPPATTPDYLKYIIFTDPSKVSIDDFDTNSSTVFGHAMANGTFSVGAAAYYDTPYNGDDPAIIRGFSSLGVTPIVQGLNGLPLANPIYRNKPDAVAVDGVNTSFFGSDIVQPWEPDVFPNFFGTSAAAPHAAAVAALMLEANGALTPEQIYTVLNRTTHDMGTAGYDLRTGYGLIDAFAAVNALQGGVFGHAYHDTDGDGVEDAGEAPFQGAVVFADANNNDTLDQSTTTYHKKVTGSTTIPDNGTLSSTFNISGVTGTVVDVNVRLDIDHPAIKTLQVKLTGPTGQVIYLSSYATKAGAMKFSTVFDDEAQYSINARPGAAESGVYRPEQALSLYDGLNPNGTWQIEVIDTAADGSDVHATTPAKLFNWAVELTTGEVSTVTDVNGNYFLPLGAGTHTLVVDPGFGYGVTEPATTNYTVTLAANEIVFDKDFGLEQVYNVVVEDMVDTLPLLGQLIDKAIKKISEGTLNSGPITPLDYLIAAQQIPYVDAKIDELIDFTGTMTEVANRLFDLASIEAEGAATTGVLSADASMLVMIDDAPPVLVTVPLGASGGLAGMVSALNSAFASAGIDPLIQAVPNGDNTRIVIQPVIPGIGNTLSVTTLFLKAGAAAAAYGQLSGTLTFKIHRKREGEDFSVDDTVTLLAAPPLSGSAPYTQNNSSVADLVDDLNAALALAGVYDVIAVVDPANANKLMFAAADASVQWIKVEDVSGLGSLGFATNDQVQTGTNTNTAQTELGLYNQRDIGKVKFKTLGEYETEVQNILNSLFTLPPSLSLSYDSVQDIMYFTVGLDASYSESINLNFNDGIDLGPFGTLEVAADGQASFEAGGDLDVRVGVHLGDLVGGFSFTPTTLLSTLNGGSGVPIAVGITGANAVAADGKLTGNASINISLDGAAAVAVNVAQNDTLSNFDQYGLAEDINNAIVTTSLAGKVEAVYDSGIGRMTLRVVDVAYKSIALAGGTNITQLGFTSVQTGDFADLTIKVDTNPSFKVDLDGALTVQDVINAIESAATLAGESITVTINDHKGLTLTEAGGQTLVVSAASNFGDNSPAAFALGIAGSSPAPVGVIVGASLHGLALGDRLFIEEKTAGQNNLGLGITVGGNLNVSAALGLISADLTTSTPLEFGINTGIRLKDPGVGINADGRIYLKEILNGSLTSLIDVNSISTTAQGQIDLNSAFFSNVDDASTLVSVGVQLLDSSPKDFSSIDFFANFNADKLKGFKDFTVEDILTIADTVITQLQTGSTLPWLNANVPVLGKSLTEAVEFLDSLRDKFNDLVASIDQSALEDARDDLETAINNLGLPIAQRDGLYQAINSLYEALAETDPDRLPARVVAAAAQLKRVIDPIVTAGTVSGYIDLGAALDQLLPLVPSLNDLSARLAAALGVAQLDIKYLDYDDNPFNGVQRTVAIHVGDTIGPVAYTDDPTLQTQEFGKLTFDAGADLNFFGGGDYDVSFGMNLDATTLADKLFVIVKPPTHSGAGAFDPTQINLNAGFDVDVTGDIGFGSMELVDGAGTLNLSNALKTNATEASSGVWNFAGTSYKDEFVIVAVNGAVHADYTVTGNTITFNSALPVTSDTVEVTYLGAAPGDPSLLPNRATLAVSLNDSTYNTGNVLGAITLNQLIDAIAGNSGPGVQVAANGLITGAVDVTALGSTANDAVTLAASLEHLLNPKLQVNEGALLSLFQNVSFDLKTIIQGLDAFLALLQDGLESEFLSKLPIAGNIDTANTFIGKLRSEFVQPLEDLLCNVGGSLEQVAMTVEQFIFDKLGPGGLNILGDRDGNSAVTVADVDVILTETLFDIRVKLAGEDKVEVDFDSGLDGLPFEVDATGGVEFGWSYELDFGFGLDKYKGFYVAVNKNSNTNPEYTLDIGAGLIVDNSTSTPIPTKVGVNLFGLNLDAEDVVDTNGDTGTFVSGVLGLALDGQEIVANSFTTYGYDVWGIYAGDLFQNFSTVFDASVTLAAQIDLLLSASPDNPDFPNVSTELYASWAMTIDTTNGVQIGTPEVEFRDITLNLGDFLSEALGPVLEKVNKYVEPIMPVVNFLLTEVPGVSDLSQAAGNGPVTFLDLAFLQNPSAGAKTKKFIGIVQQIGGIVTAINDAKNLDTGDILLNFGTLSFGSGNGVNLSDPFWNTSTNSNLNSALTTSALSVTDIQTQIAAEAANPSVKNTGAVFQTIQRDPDASGLAGLGLKFDLVQDPINIFKYLLGQTADVISWNIPRLEMNFGWEASFRPVPVVPPLKVTIGLDIGAFADLSVGFDTRGRQTGNFIDGFYFGDRANVSTGADIDELGFEIGARLRAALDVVVASGGIEGELSAGIYANLNDTDDNGKLYLDEIAGIIDRDGIDCLFDLHGELRAIIRLVWEVFGKEGSKDIIDKIIFAFEHECPTYEMGHVLDGAEILSDGNSYGAGTLVIHAGAYASQRRNGTTSDVAEDITVTRTAPGVFKVEGLGLESVYDGVTGPIYFDGGLGNDVFTFIDLTSEPAVDTFLYGGAGNDILSGGAGVDTVDGGTGSDTITTYAGKDVIRGGGDGDTIDSGDDDDTVYGDGGNDIITTGQGNDTVYGGDGNDTIDAGIGNDTIDAGNGNDEVLGGDGIDNIIGGQGNDTIDGGDGDDIIYGNAGRDIILAGDGDDEVHAGSGNDQVFGEGGNDEIYGDDGHDMLFGDNGDTRTVGAPGDDEIWAGHGNDLLVGQEGTDILMGGWGNDVILAHVIGSHAATTLDYIEGGPDDDFICASDGANTVYGGTSDFGLADIIGNPALVIFAGGFSIVSCDDEPTPIETDPNEIHGIKFDDANRNGVRDTGEALLEGWVIELRDTVGDLVDTMTTDANGAYWFTDLDPGTYIVSEVMQSGWFQTTPGGGGTYTLNLNDGDIVTGIDFGNAQGVENPGSIHGQKWEDLIGVGDRTPNSPGVNGITIELYDDQNNLVATQVTMSMDLNNDSLIDPVTEQGLYWFDDLPAGTYIVKEASSPGYFQTYPFFLEYTVVLAEGQKVEGLDFGNQLLYGSIHGKKWHDLVPDGVQDDCEIPLAGFTIYLDQNLNGILDPGELFTTTDQNGEYWFMNLTPGTYYVSELLPNSDWEQTYPGGGVDALGQPTLGYHTVDIDYGESRYNVNFGNRIPGDINGDGFVGIEDLNIVLGNWNQTFEVPNCARETGDLNGDGFIGIVDLNVVLGNWNRGQQPMPPISQAILAAAAGPLGIATDFSGTLYDVDVTGPVSLVNPRFTGLDNIADIAVSPLDGTVYALSSDDFLFTIDRVTGASTLIGSLGLPFTGTFLDGALDFNSAGELYAIRHGSSFGASRSELIVIDTVTGAGTIVGPLSTQDISAMAFDDFDQLYAVSDRFLFHIDPITAGSLGTLPLSPQPGTAEVVAGLDYDSGTGDLVLALADTFGGGTNWYRLDPFSGVLTFISATAGTISGLEFIEVQPQTGTITGTKFNDIDGDGAQGPAEQGLAGWTIYLDINDNGVLDIEDFSTVTGIGGGYSFEVAPGNYQVLEVQQPGWAQTFPFGGAHGVSVFAGVVTAGIDFGNQQLPQDPAGGITGTKFEDVNGNGVRDAAEPGLEGWTIYIDLNGNGTHDANEPFTVTDANGHYAFGNLPNGGYLIREVLQYGWEQTLPGLNFYDVGVVNGQTATGVDFGNQRGTGEVHGTKWIDLNQNGVRDPGEPGRAGVTIYIDLNGNGQYDQGEPSTITMEDDPNTPQDETGMYWLTGLTAGNLVIREVVPGGSQQTYPNGLFVGADIEGTFYDVNVTVPSKSNLQFTSIGFIIGITQKPGTGLLYAMNTNGDLYTFRRADGSFNYLGHVGPAFNVYDEGDIDIDPTTGTLYLVTQDQLYTIDLSTISSANGAGLTLVGTVPGAIDLSGIAFSASGELWVIDEATETLMRLDKANASVLFSSTNTLGAGVFDDLASLAFNPVGGELVFISPQLFASIDTTTIGATFTPATILPVPFYAHSALEFLFDGAHRVQLGSGQVLTGLDFGNTETIPLPDGDDIIHGHGGGDTIYGDNLILTDPRVVSEGTRRDTIYGNLGNDTIFGQEADDHIWGDDPYATPGTDTVDGGEGTDTIYQTVGGNQTLTDTLLTGQGPDSLIRIERAVLTGDNAVNVIDATAFSGAVQLFGLGGDDTLKASLTNTNGSQVYGGTGNDTLNGSPGPDLLDGGAGSDNINGFAGDDTYQFGNDDIAGEGDLIQDTAGNDTLDFSALPSNEPVTVDLSAIFIASHGNRTVISPNPTFFENATGGAGNDTLTGNISNNILIGNAGNDTLTGLAGNDTLIGSAGNDTLRGGTDDDTYVFDTAVGTETDTITEDTSTSGGSDTLDFGSLGSGDNLTVNLSETSSTTFGSHNNRTLVTVAPGDAAYLENVTGGTGNDSLTDNQADNTFIGNAGNDTYYFVNPTGTQTDTVAENANQGTDTLNFGAMSHRRAGGPDAGDHHRHGRPWLPHAQHRGRRHGPEHRKPHRRYGRRRPLRQQFRERDLRRRRA